MSGVSYPQQCDLVLLTYTTVFKVRRGVPECFKDIRLNTVLTITSPHIAGLLSHLEQWFFMSQTDTLQLFKVIGQGLSVMFQEQKHYNTAMDKFSDFILGRAS